MTDLVHFSADNIQKNSVLLLGNEAIARGAVEAGIGFATSYPGTPSSEVGDTLERVADGLGIKFLYSVNEKVALESAYAVSLTGMRSLGLHEACRTECCIRSIYEHCVYRREGWAGGYER
jgi:Indolepyruvate ferredoxin oxidoreductase, alpha and beta subunits